VAHDLERLRPAAAFCRDAWLMCAHSTIDGAHPCGRAWEVAVGGLLAQPGLEQRQGPGRGTLFGQTSWSGCAHELDGAGRGWRDALLVECKSQLHGVTKEDVAVFDLKTFDFYRSELPGNADRFWWRFIVSATSVSEPIRRLCVSLGITLCDPDFLPLPYLMWLATKTEVDVVIPDTMLQEILRLGERATCTMQRRWRYDVEIDGLIHKLDGLNASEISDVLFMQSEMSEAILDLHDRSCPGIFESRASWLLRYLKERKVA
jgi:hypothetical protein